MDSIIGYLPLGTVLAEKKGWFRHCLQVVGPYLPPSGGGGYYNILSSDVRHVFIHLQCLRYIYMCLPCVYECLHCVYLNQQAEYSYVFLMCFLMFFTGYH